MSAPDAIPERTRVSQRMRRAGREARCALLAYPASVVSEGQILLDQGRVLRFGRQLAVWIPVFLTVLTAGDDEGGVGRETTKVYHSPPWYGNGRSAGFAFSSSGAPSRILGSGESIFSPTA